jgi:hypothetical protein
MLLRFVEGRPVSAVNREFLDWACAQLQAQDIGVWVLVWDNAPWHSSKAVRHWIQSKHGCVPGIVVWRLIISFTRRSAKPNKLLDDALTNPHRTHPNKSLQAILQQQGMSETDIRNFVNDLRDQEHAARAQVESSGDNMGIMETTVEKLRQNMENLGVELWDW